MEKRVIGNDDENLRRRRSSERQKQEEREDQGALSEESVTSKKKKSSTEEEEDISFCSALVNCIKNRKPFYIFPLCCDSDDDDDDVDTSVGEDGNDVDAIFHLAKQHGGVLRRVKLRSPSKIGFIGNGRDILSGGTIPDATRNYVIFWTHGFTVNAELPLKALDDPEYALFLESIKKNKCPDKLWEYDYANSHFIAIVIKINENYSKGRWEQILQYLQECEEKYISLRLEEAGPTTSIKIMLPYGTHYFPKFNLHHTVGDIRDYIDDSCREPLGFYELVQPALFSHELVQPPLFPDRFFIDETLTIEQAGLENATIHVRFLARFTITGVPCTSEFKLFLADAEVSGAYDVFYVLTIGINNSIQLQSYSCISSSTYEARSSFFFPFCYTVQSLMSFAFNYPKAKGKESSAVQSQHNSGC
ncbi:hypothetical protein RIF29_08217 [Crotalaria pallida]|uniref:Uncharacterized protein n=1 Tax=Crotalaria pallida TaxID=3830 RepID=A0AAN9J548_CROPI